MGQKLLHHAVCIVHLTCLVTNPDVFAGSMLYTTMTVSLMMRVKEVASIVHDGMSAWKHIRCVVSCRVLLPGGSVSV